MRIFILYACFLFSLSFSGAAQTGNTKPVSSKSNTATAKPAPTLSQSTDSLKMAVNDFKNSMNSLFGGKRDTISIAIQSIDYDDANLSLLKEELRKAKGVKSLSLQYKSSNAIIHIIFKGKSTELWDQLPMDAKKPFRIMEANDNLLMLSYKGAAGY